MDRLFYFNYITEKLSSLAYEIEIRGKINCTDIHILSESFFADMFNLIFQYKLKNINTEKQNMTSIDLIDRENKIVVQVSAQNSKEKLATALIKDNLKNYRAYRFMFICISKDASRLKDISFSNPNEMDFDPYQDIYDIPSLLRQIQVMSAPKQRKIYLFLKKEFESDISIEKVDSDLSCIINILAEADLSDNIDKPEPNQYEIQRKIDFNNLNDIPEIPLYKDFYGRLDEKYRECDKLGINKRLAVYHMLSKLYHRLVHEQKKEYDIFYAIINHAEQIIQKSNNYIPLPLEELDLCVSIVVVDAFIRCKIFKNPEHYNYAVT
ncbi:MAG: SMEK domain-containing protein [Spirochaetia bacterium]|jgi:hypothetical protein|nr:SMEK domain-containing protein [Spirochaetia bacterium]